MPNFSNKKPYHREIISKQVEEIKSLLHVLEMRESLDGAENRPRMDMYETNDEIILEFDLPGFRLEDIRLRLNGITLVLEAFRPREQSEGGFVCMERSFGSFQYVIQIPGTCNYCAATAEYCKGVLRVVCPKIDGFEIPIKEIEP